MSRRGTSTLRMRLVQMLGLRSTQDLRCEKCWFDPNSEDEWRKNGDLNVHHILPIASGGTDDESNLICLCETCHREVHRLLSSPFPGGTAGPCGTWLEELIRLTETGYPRAREAFAFMMGMIFATEWEEANGPHTRYDTPEKRANEDRLAELRRKAEQTGDIH